jgi:hypothetical protein
MQLPPLLFDVHLRLTLLDELGGYRQHMHPNSAQCRQTKAFLDSSSRL